MSPRSLLLAPAALLLLLLAAAPAAHAKQSWKKKAERERKNLLAVCRERAQADPWCLQDEIDTENCVLRCVSKECYDEAYGTSPLEEGEVDVKRERLFRSCFEKKSRDRQAAERNAAKAALRAAKANKATRATEHGSVPEQPVVIATPVSEEDAEAIALADAEDGAAADDDE